MSTGVAVGGWGIGEGGAGVLVGTGVEVGGWGVFVGRGVDVGGVIVDAAGPQPASRAGIMSRIMSRLTVILRW